LFFDGLIQLENYLLYASATEPHSIFFWLFLVRFPFILLEHAVIALAAGGGYLVMRRWRFSLWFYFLFLCALNILVLLDQICYKLFLDHMQFALAEGDWSNASSVASTLLDSVFVDLDLIFYVNIGLWAGLSLLLWRTLFVGIPSAFKSYMLLRREMALGSLVYVGISLPVIGFNENHNLDRHVVVSLSSLEQKALPPWPVTHLSDADLYRLRFGSFAESPNKNQALYDAVQQFRTPGQLPHIVFVVLESVGSRQLFQDDSHLKTHAPFLSKLARGGIVFDAVYCNFPSTTRPHIPMATGGRTITWGRVNGEVKHRYTGPTLVNQLQRLGYSSGLFSAQDFSYENLNVFYGNLRYDKAVYYGDEAKSFDPEQEIHSWGVKEDPVRQKAVAWVDQVIQTEQPFFLHFQTISTHHPYASPPEHTGPLVGDDPESRYYNALHYTDSVLQRLYTDLKERGLAEKTLWVVSGDHGQAFGRIHPNNYTHKNALFEENIKSFLLISKTPALPAPVRSARPGNIGDIMPTILDLIGSRKADVPGQSLIAPQYKERMAYFHKSTSPERWGVRDGQWKYTARHDGKDAHLFHLGEDPTEQNNLAKHYPDRLQTYRDLCAIWYVKTNYSYIEYLEDFHLIGDKGLSYNDLGTQGPKVITIGKRSASGEFNRVDTFGPDDQVVVWNRWVPYDIDKEVLFRVESPEGHLMDQISFTVKTSWDITYLNLGSGADRIPGQWRVSIWDGDIKLIEGEFTVTQ
jgi:phosphoglycerol transferase MdoB-like AlkP superfamily enzyme